MTVGEDRHFRWGLLGVFLLAFALRLVYLLELRESLLFAAALGDGREYLAWARQIVAGNWLGDEVFYQAPLYPYLLALVQRVAGPELWPVRLLQALAGALSCGLVALAGRRFFTPRAGLAAGLLLAVYPPAIFFGALIQKSGLALFLLCLLLALLAEAAMGATGRRSAIALVGTGLVLGALALTRENALVLVPVLALWTVVGPFRQSSDRQAPDRRPTGNQPPDGRPHGSHAPSGQEPDRRPLRNQQPGRRPLGHRPPGRRWIRLALLLGGLVLALLPVGLRNQAVGGRFLLTTSQLGSNLYIGNHAGADGRYMPLRPGRQDARVEREDAAHLAEAALGRKLSPDEVSSYWRRQALAFITANPGEWTLLMGRKLHLLLHADEVVDTESLEAYRAESVTLRLLSPAFHFGLLLALAALGAWSVRRRWRDLWILGAMVLALGASVVIFYVVARYRFLLVPPLALFAGAGVVDLVARLRRRDWVSILSALALIAAIVWLTMRPLPIRTVPAATTWYNLGVVLFEEGDDDAARRALERAVELAPEVAPIQVQLGRVAQAQGRTAAAGRYFRAATAADSRSLDARRHLAQWALATGDRETAAAEYRRAVDLAASDPESWLPVAQGLALAGESEAAESLLRRALEIDPENGPAWNLLGNLQAQQGQTTVARASYEQALTLDPNLADAHFKLAILLTETGELEEARRHLETTVRLAPEYAEAAERLREVERVLADK